MNFFVLFLRIGFNLISFCELIKKFDEIKKKNFIFVMD